MEPVMGTVLWTVLSACCFLGTVVGQTQECDPVPVLRCYGGLLSGVEADMDRLTAKYGTELDAALRTFASKHPASSSPCKLRPGEQARCTQAEREQLDRLEAVYEVFQRTVSDDQSLRDMISAYKCWDRRKYRDCFASLLQDTLIRQYIDAGQQDNPQRSRICKKWSSLSGSCFDESHEVECPEGNAAAGRQHFRDLLAAYVASFGCPYNSADVSKPSLLGATLLALVSVLLLRTGAIF